MSEDSQPAIYVIIPAFNEENAVGKVIADLPSEKLREIIVVNNNSNDQTSTRAREAGATVLDEPNQGYGRACLKGIAYLQGKAGGNDIVVFLDADYSDHPEQLPKVTAPIERGDFDFVIGSRTLGRREEHSMTFAQIFGNKLACFLMRLIFGVKYTDLGPFRAIRYQALKELKMADQTYGWTVEMQIKAVKNKLRVTEVAVDYRNRIGFSKISGTVKGTVLAGYKIIATILKYS